MGSKHVSVNHSTHVLVVIFILQDLFMVCTSKPWPLNTTRELERIIEASCGYSDFTRVIKYFGYMIYYSFSNSNAKSCLCT